MSGALATYRRLFSNTKLLRLLVGEFVSGIGDWLYMVAMLVVVYDVAGDPLLLGVIGAARILPYVVLSVPAGVLADRFDRRTILIVADLARAAVMILLAVLVIVGAPAVTIVVVAILSTCASTFFVPAIRAYLPSLARDESELGPANSAWATLDSFAFIIGPAVAGVLIAVTGAIVAFILNAISFFLAAAVLATLPRGMPRVAHADGDHSGRVTRDSPDTRRTLIRVTTGPALLDVATSATGGAVGMLTVILAVDHLGAGDAGTGYLNAATGVGGLVAGVLAGYFVLRGMTLPLVGGALVAGASLVALGLVTDFTAALVAIGIAIGAVLVLDVINATVLQRLVPDELRGRAAGIVHTTGSLAFAGGSFAAPVLAVTVGIPTTMAVIAAVLVGVTLAGVAVLLPSGALSGRSERDERALELLRRSPLGVLPAPRLAAAAHAATSEGVDAGSVVIRQGDEADRFYVIASGEFEVTQESRTGAARLRTLAPGDAFGEIGLLESRPRTATVTATTPGELLVLGRDTFLELVGLAPSLEADLLGMYRGSPGGRPLADGAQHTLRAGLAD